MFNVLELILKELSESNIQLKRVADSLERSEKLEKIYLNSLEKTENGDVL